jgi:signal transduction histidine kinase
VPEVAGPRSLRHLIDAVLIVSSDLDLPSMLLRIVHAAVDLVDARFGALGVLDATQSRLAQFITVGLDDEARARIGDLPEGHGLLGALIVDARPLRLPDLRLHPDSYGFPPNHPEMRSFLGVPIRVRDEVFGNLYLTDKTTADAFTDVDEELAVGLAGAAGVAIENTRLHTRLYEIGMIEDRERIARDLHDTVIQRLFATGLALQGAARMATSDPEATQQRIETAIDDLDTTVKQIRTSIFDLEASGPRDTSLREQVLAIAREATTSLRSDPRVRFDGPVDTVVTEPITAHLLATLREALSNVARHAEASEVEIDVVARDGQLSLQVTDDGIGPTLGDAGDQHDHLGLGLTNLARRAEVLGGTLQLEPRDPRGTRLVWRVPLS